MKVLLVHDGSCEDELKQLRIWLEAEDCEVAVFDLNPQSAGQQKALTEAVTECEALGFLITSKLPLSEVQTAVLAANAKGKKIVGIQLGPHVSIEAFEKYGSASVPLKHNMVIGAICGHRFAWIDEDGNPREDQEMEHHKCKKQKRSQDKNAAA